MSFYCMELCDVIQNKVAWWSRDPVIQSVKGSNSNTTPEVGPGFVWDCIVITWTRKCIVTSHWLVSGWGGYIITPY